MAPDLGRQASQVNAGSPLGRVSPTNIKAGSTGASSPSPSPDARVNMSRRATRQSASNPVHAQLVSNQQEDMGGRARRRTEQLMQLLATGGRLGTFVTLNMSKLEVKLLEEQRRTMEQEQEALLAKWAAPTRGGTSPRADAAHATQTQRSGPVPRSESCRISPRVASATTKAQHKLSGQHDVPHLASLIVSPSSPHLGTDGSSRDQGEEPGTEPGLQGFSSPRQRIVRPEVITSSSARLLQVFQEERERRAVLARAALLAEQAQSPHSVHRLGRAGFISPLMRGRALHSAQSRAAPEGGPNTGATVFAGQPITVEGMGQQQPPGMSQLTGSALAAQAKLTIQRAERLLERLKASGIIALDFDSRAGTSPDDDLLTLEEQLEQLKQRTTDTTDMQSRQPSELPKGRSIKRQASLWAKSLSGGAMLSSVYASSTLDAKRHGLSGPSSLATMFVTSLGHGNSSSLATAAGQRLEMMQRLERMLDTMDERDAPDREALQRYGLAIAEHILQDLQGRLDAAETAAAVSPRAHTASRPDNALDATVAPASPALSPGLASALDAPAVVAHRPGEGAEGASETGQEGVVAESSQQPRARLAQLRDTMLPSTKVVTSSGRVQRVPLTPDGAHFSGLFGRNSDYRKRERQMRAALIQQNPAAFQEEVAELAEAQYRALAERAHVRYIMQSRSRNEPHLIEQFMTAIQYLRADRPYFLPPLTAKQPLRRPTKQSARKATPEWVVDGSVFDGRKREAEGRDVYDTERVKMQQFTLDWQRVATKTRFRRLVGRMDQAVQAEEQRLEEELGQVRMVMTKYRDVLRSMFTYYSCVQPWARSEDMLVVTMSQWLQFVADANIIEDGQPGCSTADLEGVFVAVNYEEEKGTVDADANDDHAMMRFEFMEGLVRAAFGKYIQPGLMDDASDAVGAFMEELVIPNMAPAALVDPNQFRRERLYCKEMASSICEWFPLLQAMHKLYRAKDHTKHFWIEHWIALLESCRLLGPHTGLHNEEAKLLFCWSQLVVTDELRRRKRAISLVMFDFIEAVARVADFVSPPLEDDLEAFLKARQGPQDLRTTRVEALRMGASNSTGASSLNGRAHATTGNVWTGYAGRFAEFLNLGIKEPSEVVHVRRKSSGLLQERGRALQPKFEALMDYMLACMRDQWGGRSMEDCSHRMTKTANVLSGGIELA